jgi:hypothetical protein
VLVLEVSPCQDLMSSTEWLAQVQVVGVLLQVLLGLCYLQVSPLR